MHLQPYSSTTALRLSSRRIAKHLAFAFLSLALLNAAIPLQAQEHDLRELFSGNSVPLSVQLRNLESDWRRITVANSGSVSGNIAVNVSGNSSAATSQNNITGALASSRSYITKGDAVAIAGRRYLVAYHLPAAGLDLGKVLQMLATKTPSTNSALSPESTLPLCFLDLGSMGSIEDIRPFDAKAEIADSEKAAQALSDLIKSQSGSSSSSKTNAPSASQGDSAK